MPRNYSPTTLKRLFALSGFFCCYPSCITPIYSRVDGEDVLTGEIAHIESSSDDGPRANPSLTPAQRDAYENLILLCPTHHALVDAFDSAFSVATLLQWKAEAARAHRERLALGSSNVTFAELALICDAFSDGFTPEESTPMRAPDLDAKMAANGLTGGISYLMTVGLAQAGMVEDFIRRQAQIAPRFPERLRGGFLSAYDHAVQEGQVGDDVFMSLVTHGADAVVDPQSNQQRVIIAQSASLAVICHLFEICELFEAPA